MIKENQQLLNRLNVLSDGLIIYLMFPVAFWLRFYVLKDGHQTMLLQEYLRTGIWFTVLELFVMIVTGMYRPFRHVRLRYELGQLWTICTVCFLLLLSWLSLRHLDDYSRQLMFLYFALSVGLLSLKRFTLRQILWRMRAGGYNLKHVIVIGDGKLAERYLDKIQDEITMGYHPVGYISERENAGLSGRNIPWLGSYEKMEQILEKRKPDEVISAIDSHEFERTPQIIAACEKAGCKLSVIPIYAEYMSGNQQLDDLDGIPLLNVRKIPLDNLANAFLKRSLDILASALILIVFSPLMLFCAIGVKMSSPGPIIFAQKRIGRNKKPFMMYKFRSMRVNDSQDTGWSGKQDSRKTRFGSFIRKYSLDEFPQFWNVLKGDMSLVGPRPEVPFYVEQFKEEVPRYMLKHLVRPGITGWAQVNDLRGDTSIPQRIRYDIYYIENWSLWFDLKILFLTVFGGKFKNDEVIS